MGRVQDIILRVRDTLADPSGDRWSDERLLRLFNEAQKDICVTTKLLKSKTLLQVINGNPYIKLPSDLIAIDKLIYNNRYIPLKSIDDFDMLLVDTGTEVEYAIYDKRNRQQLRIYPILIDSISSVEGIVEDYGVLASSSDFTITPDFGVVTNGYLSTDVNIFGVATKLTISSSILGLYYSRYAKTINTLDDNTELDSITDLAIKYYITGRALSDDMDTQNRSFGEAELFLYNKEIAKLVVDIEKNFVTSTKQLQTSYEGF